MSTNTQRIAQLYEAFGRGDIGTIMEQVTDDFVVEAERHDHGIPWQKPGRGRDAFLQFFQNVAAELTWQRFDVITIMANGPWVVVLASLECTVNRTGKRIVETCEPHVWTVDENGRATSLRHCADTHHQWLALQP